MYVIKPYWCTTHLLFHDHVIRIQYAPNMPTMLACSGALILMNRIKLLACRCFESITSIPSEAGSAIHHIWLNWLQLEEPDPQLPIQFTAWFRRLWEYECMLNWRLMQVWNLEEQWRRGMSKAFCQSSSIMYANFDLVDTKIYMCNCRFVSVQITKVDDMEPWVSCTRTFECVKLSRWRMGARLVTLYVDSSSVDTSIHRQDFSLHSWMSQTSTWSFATAVVTCNYTCANIYGHKH